MKRSKMESKYVCQRCGLSVSWWVKAWKHHANGATGPSCRAPIPVLKDEYRKEIQAMLDTAGRFLASQHKV